MGNMGGLFVGVAVPLLLLASGVYFAVRLGGTMLRHPLKTAQGMRAGMGGETGAPWRRLCVALAGTLGVGNIAGVASAIALGGAGAVFWMWVAALLAMFLKYAEIVLAYATRKEGEGEKHGGAMYYIRVSFGGRVGRFLAVVFAVFCFGCMFTLGGMMQSNAAAEALQVAFSLPRGITGLLLSGAVFVLLSGKSLGVERICSFLVPLLCLLFMGLSFAVLFLKRGEMGGAFTRIFLEAFSTKSVAGGVFGVLTSRAVRYGVSRGLVSNEAGCGTAPIAHAGSTANSPVTQGLWGILEVFVDTVLLCTLTALVILVSGVPTFGEGVTLAMRAFSAVLGERALSLLAFCIAMFALATLLCWSHYGAECLFYLFPHRQHRTAVSVAVALAAFLGAVTASPLVWELTDFVLGAMTVLNIMALWMCREKILKETRCFYKKSPLHRGGATEKRKSFRSNEYEK